MKNGRRKNIREKGITLVALVVTIIVLLILAGVTINMALSNNGLIQRAKDASETYARAEQEEQEDMDYFAEAIDSKGEATPGKKVTISTSKDGTNLKEVINNGTALNTLYQEKVDYTSEEGVDWLLFYDDDTNIYLIASDYVPVSTLRDELNKESGEATQKYKAWFASGSSPNFTGPIMETGEWSKGTKSTTITSNPLTSKYLRWVGSGVDTVETNPNMKAVAYMMDTSKWSNFAGEAKGAYAIGGPTLEMFVKSWNNYPDHSGETNQLGTYWNEDGSVNIISTNANSNGYKVKKGTGNWSNYGNSGDLGTTTNMWCIHETGKAYGMWVASPSSYDRFYVSLVNCGDVLRGDYVNYINGGFRPVVSIPKSSLQ